MSNTESDSNNTAQDQVPSGTAEQQLADIAAAERRATADNTIKNHVMVAMGFGLVPVPLFDVALMVGNQVKMVHSLSGLYDTPFQENQVKSIIISLVGGSLPTAGVMGLSSGIKLIPGIGSLVGSGSVSVIGGALTYAVGKVFVEHFESGGSLLDFDLTKMREKFKKEVENGEQVAAQAKAEAAA